MKKLGLLSLLFCLCLSGCSCGGDPQLQESRVETNEETETDENGNVKINLETDENEETIETVQNTNQKVDLIIGDVTYEHGSVDLGRYNQIPHNIVKEEVTPEMIESRLNALYFSVDPYLTLTGGTASRGDYVNVSFTATDAETGEVLDQSDEDGLRIKLGNYSYYEGFDDGIYGLSTGETNSFDIDYLYDYQEENHVAVNDRMVHFDVTLNGVYQETTPVADPGTDTYVSTYLSDTTGCHTVDELRVYAEEQLNQETENTFQQERQNMVFTQLVKESEIEEYDPNLEDYYYDFFYQCYVQNAREQNIPLDDFAERIGSSVDEIRSDCEEIAQYSAMADTALVAVAEEEGLSNIEEAKQYVLENSYYDEDFRMDLQLEEFYNYTEIQVTN